MKKIRSCLRYSAATAIVAVSASLLAAPELYRWVDKNGNVTYSDTPPPKDAVSSQKKKLGDNSVDGGEGALPYALKLAVQRNPVILYVNNCGEICDQARALLVKRGIPFVSRNPETDPGASEALKELIGALSVPSLAVGSVSQTGFNESGWNSALDGAGYPKFNVLSANLKTPPKPIVEPLKAPASAARADPAAPATTTQSLSPSPQ